MYHHLLKTLGWASGVNSSIPGTHRNHLTYAKKLRKSWVRVIILESIGSMNTLV